MSLPFKSIFSYHNLSDPYSKVKTQVISDCKKGKDGHSKAVKEDVTATITRLPCLGGYDLNTKSNAAILLRVA